MRPRDNCLLSQAGTHHARPRPYAKIPIGLLDAGLARTPSASPGRSQPGPCLVARRPGPRGRPAWPAASAPDPSRRGRVRTARPGAQSQPARLIGSATTVVEASSGSTAVSEAACGSPLVLQPVPTSRCSAPRPARCMPIKQPGPSSRSCATAAPGIPPHTMTTSGPRNKESTSALTCPRSNGPGTTRSVMARTRFDVVCPLSVSVLSYPGVSRRAVS